MDGWSKLEREPRRKNSSSFTLHMRLPLYGCTYDYAVVVLKSTFICIYTHLEHNNKRPTTGLCLDVHYRVFTAIYLLHPSCTYPTRVLQLLLLLPQRFLL